MKFYIVDVFAETKYAGNQLAVFLDAEPLSTETMQQITLEMNYSESTFILRSAMREGGYDVRIFTPASEIPFAGHPTLGSAFIIQQMLIGSQVEGLTLNLGVGQIPVTISYQNGAPDELWMHQKSPDFAETFDPQAVAAALNLDVSDIDTRFPIQDVSTGLPFIIAPIKTLAAVKRAEVDQPKFRALVENSRAKSIHIFCPEAYHAENDLNARMFSHLDGIGEDPATGSANGCLAGYLVKHRYFGTDEIDVRVEQGYEIKRPSLLLLRAKANAGSVDIFVGGRVVLVAEGELVA